MRPPRIKHNSLRYPLDSIFGSEASVRLMRVFLYEASGPLGITDAAQLAGLSTPGTRKSLDQLRNLGVVMRVGSGRALKYALKQESTYTNLLRQMFEEEERQYESLLSALRDAVGVPEVDLAWVVLSDSRQAIELTAVVDSAALSSIGAHLRTRLLPTEKQRDLIIEVNLFTRADGEVVPDDAVVLWGVVDTDDREWRSQTIGREDSAERSRKSAQAVAELVRRDPSLAKRALQHVERLLREGQGTANADLAEWKQLLEAYSVERLADLLVARSPRADRLRRSSPFLAVLTRDQRDWLREKTEHGE